MNPGLVLVVLWVSVAPFVEGACYAPHWEPIKMYGSRGECKRDALLASDKTMYSFRSGLGVKDASTEALVVDTKCLVMGEKP